MNEATIALLALAGLSAALLIVGILRSVRRARGRARLVHEPQTTPGDSAGRPLSVRYVSDSSSGGEESDSEQLVIRIWDNLAAGLAGAKS